MSTQNEARRRPIPPAHPHSRSHQSAICHGSNLFQNRRFLPNLTTAIVLLMTTGRIGGTCNEEQIETCRESALDGRLASLKSGGQCSPKHYAEFSHLCSVTNYLPNVEYCCCIYETNVLCCRYHQDWNLFRCQVEEDMIDSTSGSVDHLDESNSQSSLCCPPLELLLPAILVPLVVIFCCLYVCFKYWRQCGDGGCSSQTEEETGTISPRKNRRAKDAVELALSASLTSSDANSTLPLTCNNHVTTEKQTPYPLGDSTGEAGHPLYDDDYVFQGLHRFYPTVEPSAPPLTDGQEITNCALSHCYHESSEPYEEFCGSRYRDFGGRARPLYRIPRNFSSGGRYSAPLVHRMNSSHSHFRSAKYDRSAACRGVPCPVRACSESPPPPSYEQSCNQNS